MIAHLHQELETKAAEIKQLRESVEIRTQDGTVWREQLIENDINPKPRTWIRLPKEDP